MENKKQSSIEWFVEELIKAEYIDRDSTIMNYVVKLAKERHKQEIIDAYNEGFGEGWGNIITNKEEEYYNQTFNQ